MLINVGEVSKQASFLMPSVFVTLLMNQFEEVILPIPQDIPEFLCMSTWCKIIWRYFNNGEKEKGETLGNKLTPWPRGEPANNWRGLEERERRKKGKAIVQTEPKINQSKSSKRQMSRSLEDVWRRIGQKGLQIIQSQAMETNVHTQCDQDVEYKQFMKNVDKRIPKGLEGIIPKLGTWIIKCDRERKHIFILKLQVVEAKNKIMDVVKQLKVTNKQVAALGEDLQFAKWKTKKLEKLLKKHNIKGRSKELFRANMLTGLLSP
eukprot:Gb_33540 [translate_table: standard]